MASARRILPQAVGAYGEKAVEAELLRHGWVTANINTSIKNAADFDIFAHKGERAISVRVKAAGPGINAFQFGFRSKQSIVPKNISPADFTILVSMGAERAKDKFYVLPTRLLREQIEAHRASYMSHTRRDGEARVDVGMWTLHLAELRSGEDRFSHGYEKKWLPYLDKWASLEVGTPDG